MKEISKHIFIFPFTWKYKSKKHQTLILQHQQIKESRFKKLTNWTPIYFSIQEDQMYNEFIYFYKPIRSALYTFSNKPIIVRNYIYKNLDDKSLLKLSVKGKTYHLKIKHIGLKLYKTGIGLLSIHLSNEEYAALEAIEAINSLSQCIYPPVLPLTRAREEGTFPESLSLRLGKETFIEEQFQTHYYKDGLKITPFILELLGKPFVEKPKKIEKGSIIVEPLLGHQMFTLCLYENEKLVRDILVGRASYERLEQVITLSQKRIYLEADDIPAHVGSTYYLKSEDTIYGINRNMLFCIARKLPRSRLYNELVSLVLMQRATLLNLSTEIARVSTLPKGELAPAISSIYEVYIQFINQLYFKEVTEESEGTGLYEKLSKELCIEEELNQLNFEMNEVNEYATLVEQSNSGFKVQLLTIIGAALVVPSFVTGFFGMNIFKDEIYYWWESPSVLLWLNTYVLFPIIVVTAFCTLNKRRTKGQYLLKLLLICIVLGSVVITLKRGCGL